MTDIESEMSSRPVPNWQECREWFNEYLSSEKGKAEVTAAGVMLPLFTCPCCDYPTLEERRAWEICWVCWWEDDGDATPGLKQAWVNFEQNLFYRLVKHIFETARQEELRREGFAAFQKMLVCVEQERVQLWRFVEQCKASYLPASTALTLEVRAEIERRRSAKE